MTRYVKLLEICIELQVDDEMLREVTDEGLVEVRAPASGGEPLVSAEDAERLRVIRVLMREMGVNLAGVEVILHMREDALSLRRQVDEMVRDLVRELRLRLER